jgi:hypothetical protein
MAHSALSVEANALRNRQEGSCGKAGCKVLERRQEMVGYIETIIGDGLQQRSHHLLFQRGGASVRHKSPLVEHFRTST